MIGFLEFITSLNTAHWIALVALTVAVISATFAGLNYFGGRAERLKKNLESLPTVKVTINRKGYGGGWRSVQLHVVPLTEGSFATGNWRIQHMKLLRPWNAILARAKDDDYASGVFYSEHPIKEIDGKEEGRLQRFALEFFIKFSAFDDRGQAAKFRIIFSHIDGSKRKTLRLWASVPNDAEKS